MKMPFNTEEKGKLVQSYFDTKSIVQTQGQYQKHFANRNAPDRKAISGILKKFQIERTIYVNKGRSVQTRGARTEH